MTNASIIKLVQIQKESDFLFWACQKRQKLNFDSLKVIFDAEIFDKQNS